MSLYLSKVIASIPSTCVIVLLRKKNISFFFFSLSICFFFFPWWWCSSFDPMCTFKLESLYSFAIVYSTESGSIGLSMPNFPWTFVIKLNLMFFIEPFFMRLFNIACISGHVVHFVSVSRTASRPPAPPRHCNSSGAICRLVQTLIWVTSNLYGDVLRQQSPWL